MTVFFLKVSMVIQSSSHHIFKKYTLWVRHFSRAGDMGPSKTKEILPIILLIFMGQAKQNIWLACDAMVKAVKANRTD